VSTLNVEAPGSGNPDKAFLDSVYGEVNRIFEAHQSGSLTLRPEYRRALEETERSVSILRCHGHPALQGRIAEVTDRIESLLAADRQRSQAQPTLTILSTGVPLPETGPAPVPSPPPVPSQGAPSARSGSRQRRRGWRRASIGLACLITAGGLGYLALHNDRAAARWHQLDQSQTATAQHLSRQLESANNNITSLSNQVNNLNADVAILNDELSSVANQKQRPLTRP